jgi:putative SOS response-associated peptidase YedK
VCGRYTLTTAELSQLRRRFDFRAGHLPYVPRYNIAATQHVLIVLDLEGERRADYFRWGLIPPWAQNDKVGRSLINARAETAATTPVFRNPFRKRRCIIPADGFYEWKDQQERKAPVYVTLKSREPFALAGLWEEWRSPAGRVVRSCAILTTAANSLIAPIHDRMPAILSREAEGPWLDTAIEDPAELEPLLKPYPAEEMEAWSVSLLVNSPRNETPACIKPVK